MEEGLRRVRDKRDVDYCGLRVGEEGGAEEGAEGPRGGGCEGWEDELLFLEEEGGEVGRGWGDVGDGFGGGHFWGGVWLCGGISRMFVCAEVRSTNLSTG